MTEFLAACLIFIFGWACGNHSRYRPSKPSMQSAERRQMLIKDGEL